MSTWSFNIGTWTLNAIDIIILVICLGRGIFGAVRGFFSDFSHTAGLIGGPLLGLLFTSTLFEKFQTVAPSMPPMLLSYLIFICLVLVGYIALRLIGNAIDKTMEAIHIDGVSTVLGFFWGVIVGVVTLSISFYVLSLQHIFDVSRFFDGSLFISKVIQPLLPNSLDYLKDLINV